MCILTIYIIQVHRWRLNKLYFYSLFVHICFITYTYLYTLYMTLLFYFCCFLRFVVFTQSFQARPNQMTFMSSCSLPFSLVLSLCDHNNHIYTTTHVLWNMYSLQLFRIFWIIKALDFLPFYSFVCDSLWSVNKVYLKKATTMDM